jgi:hypothetical protein
MHATERLTATVDAFSNFINQLPGEALQEQLWGPKEILAHILFYHESVLAQLRTLLQNEPFQPPEGRFSDLNAQAVAASQGVPVSELVDRLRIANQSLCRLAERADLGSVLVEIKKGAKLRALDDLVPELEAHIRNHHRKLAFPDRSKGS